jgi:hypothetical protein
MRMVTNLRNLSLGVAAASFLFAGVGFAQSTELTGGTARLDQTIDAQHASPGQQVQATLNDKIETAGGVELPKGTELLGTISSAQASENHGPSTVSLAFTKAQLKDGKTIPVKVMLLGAYPSGDSGNPAGYGQNLVGPAPKHISPSQKIDQEPGLLSHTSMTASAEGSNSATFRDRDGNLKLRQGTYFQVGVAPLNGNTNGMTQSGS